MLGRQGSCLKPARAAAGFTYLGILFAVAFIGVSLAATATVTSTATLRSRERELLFVGHEFRDAISSYYRAGIPGAFTYPRSLSDLIEDRRGPVLRRHLRRIYSDPMTGAADWEQITLPDGSMIGIASSSRWKPLKSGNFLPVDQAFEGARCYCDWRFIFLPQENLSGN
jgi:type II secretory pathway pseudopilin PulG